MKSLADVVVFLLVIAVCLLVLSVFAALIVATWRSML